MDLVVLGLSASVIGAIIVLAGLAMIIGGVLLLRSVKREKVEAHSVSTPRKADDMPVVLAAAVTAAMEQAEQEQLIAVLTAAVAALWEDQESGFVVRKVRRVNTSPIWQKAGREEQIYSRM